MSTDNWQSESINEESMDDGMIDENRFEPTSDTSADIIPRESDQNDIGTSPVGINQLSTVMSLIIEESISQVNVSEDSEVTSISIEALALTPEGSVAPTEETASDDESSNNQSSALGRDVTNPTATRTTTETPNNEMGENHWASPSLDNSSSAERITQVDLYLKQFPKETTTFDHNGETATISLERLHRRNEIGSGQFGKVYHVQIEEPIPLSMAVKEIRMTSDAQNRLAIYRELQALEIIHSCPSPYVLDFYCVLNDPYNAICFICMPLMEMTVEMFYRTMHQLEQIQSSDVYTFVRRCAHDLITGLKYLKDRGIVHRDVKPTNLLMDSNGQIKLCDFGISGRLDPTEPDFVVNVGTTHYLPPKPDKCSIRNDIWAAGMSLLEIAKGEHPLTTIHSDSVQFRLNHWKVPSMEEIDEDIRRLILRLFGFEQRSESRPDSYEDIIRETFIGTMSENRSPEERRLFQRILGGNLSKNTSDEAPRATNPDEDLLSKILDEVDPSDCFDKILPSNNSNDETSLQRSSFDLINFQD